MSTFGTAFFCIILPLIGAMLLIIVPAMKQSRLERETREAHASYQEALRKLKASPLNPDLKRNALEYGRAYSNLTRQRKGVTVFDEVALMNDISAATAGATAFPSPSPFATAPAQQPIEARLKKLDDLKAQGVISEQEYTTRRQQILSEV
jgi:hypothetical protein